MVLNIKKIKKLMSVIVKKEYSKYGLEYCELIEDQKVEHCQVIEGQKVEYYEIIEDQEVEIVEDQNVQDINMLKLSRDDVEKLNLKKNELQKMARVRGVKNYENLSKRRLVKEINKLEPFKKRFWQEVFEKYPKEDELKRKDFRKSFRLKKKKEIIIGKEKRRVEKIRSKKDNKKIFEIKKIVKSLLLNKKEKMKKIEKIINIPKKNPYKPVKISGAFSDNFVEYKSNSEKDR